MPQKARPEGGSGVRQQGGQIQRSPREVSNWPSVSFESVPWREGWRSYEAAVVPAISGLDVAAVLDPATAAEVGAAERAVHDFDAQMTEAFGAMELGVIDAVLLRSEAASSSQIEQITVSSKQIALAQTGQSKSVNAKLVARNVEAMHRALGLAEFATPAVVDVQRVLLGDTQLHLGLRTEPVWIGTNGMSPIGADYVAPVHTSVPAALEDLWRFMRQSAPLPLAQIAVAHAQFETIHPFVDGNGRTGRALVNAYVRTSGMASHVTVPVSAGLLSDTRGYVDALNAYRQGDVLLIVHVFAVAARNAAEIGMELIASLQQARRSWDDRIHARSDSVVWRIADALVGQPVVTARSVSVQHDVTQVAARSAITVLVEAGVLRKASTGTRNQVWVAEEITTCYDRIAILIGRRKPF